MRDDFGNLLRLDAVIVQLRFTALEKRSDQACSLHAMN
jgi:hypothetical protein